MNDFYFGSSEWEYPMGHISFVGKLDADTLRAGAPKIAPGWTLELMANHSLDFWLTSEELPDPNNRVTLDRNEEIVLAYMPNNLQGHERLKKKLQENDADAEEAAQEAVLKAFMHIGEFRAESKFSTWLIQIAINEARMKLRKEHRSLYESLDEPRTDEEGDFWPSDCADWREIPSEALELKELRDALTKAMAALPSKYRQVLICRDIQQLNIAETAQVLGISEVNVRQRLLRARLQMRDALAPGFDGAWTRGRTYEKVRPW